MLDRMHTAIERCELCNSLDVAVVATQASMKEGVPQDVTNVICNRCGLIFNNPMPSAEKLTQFYQGDYFEATHKFKSGREEYLARLPERTKKAKGVAQFIAPFLKKDQRVLEVGCSIGRLLAVLRDDYDMVAHGIEPDPGMSEFARTHFKLEQVRSGFFEKEITSFDTKFDLIILRHVLEHLFDVNQVIRTLKERLSEQGCIYLAFPSAHNPTPSRKIDRVLEYSHLRTFTPFTIRELLLRHGLKIVSFSYDFVFHMQIIATRVENNVDALPFSCTDAGSNIANVKRILKYQNARHALWRAKRKALSLLGL